MLAKISKGIRFKPLAVLAALLLLAATASGDTWSQQAKLTASDGARFDSFGSSVAFNGDTVVVGAYRDDDACPSDINCNSGSAYVFVRDGDGNWSQQAKLTAPDGSAGDNFGESVALDGDTAIVGARDNDAPLRDSGSAYVFVRSGTTWSPQAKLTGDDGGAFDRFGNSVALVGNTAMVGAPLNGTEPGNPADGPGAAYVFVRAGTTWSQQAKLTGGVTVEITPPDFGESVALSGNTALVGAYTDNDNGSNAGSAYVFVRDGGGGWSLQAKLTATDGADQDQFGRFISVNGDTVLVGANGDDSQLGSAYVFVRNGINWNQSAKLTASDGSAGDRFGVSVSVSGNIALVGANLDDDKGSAYLFVPCLAFGCDLTIIQPPDDAVFNSGTAIIFQATATDPEDGDIRDSTVWTSDIQPGSRSGAVVEATNMIDGVHTVTATVTDSAGNTLSESITITISNNPPTVAIIQPLDGAAFDSGEDIVFQAAATDPEDGDISDSIVWTSDIQEGSKTGADLMGSNLIDGVHTITASVTDSLGNTSTDSITIAITIAIGPPP